MRILLVVLLLIPAMATQEKPEIEFADVTETSGLLQPLLGMMGHAAAWGDLDRDGDPDLFVGGFCDRPVSEYRPAKGPVPARLFRNLGNGKFILIKNSPTEFCGRTSGAVFADLNLDGFPELYVSNNSKDTTLPGRLFLNTKSGLRDITATSGAAPGDVRTARNIGVFDFNKDGLPDLFLVEDKFTPDKRPPGSILLLNQGNLRFRIANKDAGIPDGLYGLGFAIADLNEDNAPDFFIAHSNRLFISQKGNTYREVSAVNRIFQWNPIDDEDWPCGAVFGDLNLDAKSDLVITAHHDPAKNRVFLNRGLRQGLPLFEEVTEKIGLGKMVPAKSTHVEIQDFDNDGLPDIYISAAWKKGKSVIPLIYRNTGIGKNGLPQFKPLREPEPPMIYFPAGPTADFNKDGKIDIFLVNWFGGGTSHLLKNQTAGGNWLQVKASIGSKIELHANGKLVGYQQLFIGYGFASGQLPVCHFGLGTLKSVDLKITLPNGVVKKLNANANQVKEIR